MFFNVGVTFTAQPEDTEVDCDDKTAIFPCRYTGSIIRPQWVINSTAYSSISVELPNDHRYSNHTLYVDNVKSKHNSTYQCQILSTDGRLCAYKSTIGRLIVKCQGIQLSTNYFAAQ